MANDEFDDAQSQTVDKVEVTIHRERNEYQIVVNNLRARQRNDGCVRAKRSKVDAAHSGCTPAN